MSVFSEQTQGQPKKLPDLNNDGQQIALHRTNRTIDIANQLMPIEDRIAKLESMDTLNRRLQCIETSGSYKLISWWNRLGEFILSAGFVTALISLILGFFQWILSKARFKHESQLSTTKFNHESNLSNLEHQNKWRNEYLSKALDSKLDLSIRLQYLRFLQGTSQDDPAIAEWAKKEIDIFRKAQEDQIEFQGKKAQLTDMQSSVPRIRDSQTKKQQTSKIKLVENEISIIKKRLLSDGFVPVE
jgi:hypothetical protein